MPIERGYKPVIEPIFASEPKPKERAPWRDKQWVSSHCQLWTQHREPEDEVFGVPSHGTYKYKKKISMQGIHLEGYDVAKVSFVVFFCNSIIHSQAPLLQWYFFAGCFTVLWWPLLLNLWWDLVSSPFSIFSSNQRILHILQEFAAESIEWSSSFQAIFLSPKKKL